MKKRVEVVDGLRGFSLLGILVANLLIFQYGMIGREFMKEDLAKWDLGGYYVTKVLIEASFIPIFTFLFGYSLIKLVDSIKKRQEKTRWVLIRRAIGLLVLGGLHAKYIWDGDILTFYGGFLFVLLFFIYRKPKTLFIWAGVLFIGIGALVFGQPIELYDEQKLNTYLTEEHTVNSTGTYAEVLDFRASDELPVSDEVSLRQLVVMLGVLIMYMPLFLLGMACAKLKFFESPEREMPIYRKLTWLIVVGIVLKILGEFDTNYADFFTTIGGPILSIGYIGAFAWWYHAKMAEPLKNGFGAVGKLSLTNYLMQSVICTFVFYGYGLGFYDKMGVTLGLLFGLVVYSLQLFWSQWYIRRFSRGPVEKVLRIWTNWSWRR